MSLETQVMDQMKDAMKTKNEALVNVAHPVHRHD